MIMAKYTSKEINAMKMGMKIAFLFFVLTSAPCAFMVVNFFFGLVHIHIPLIIFALGVLTNILSVIIFVSNHYSIKNNKNKG